LDFQPAMKLKQTNKQTKSKSQVGRVYAQQSPSGLNTAYGVRYHSISDIQGLVAIKWH